MALLGAVSGAPPPTTQPGVGLDRERGLVEFLAKFAHRLPSSLPLVRVDLVMSLKHKLADRRAGGWRTNLPPEIGEIFLLVSGKFQQEFCQLLRGLIVQNIDIGLRGSLLLVFCCSQD